VKAKTALKKGRLVGPEDFEVDKASEDEGVKKRRKKENDPVTKTKTTKKKNGVDETLLQVSEKLKS